MEEVVHVSAGNDRFKKNELKIWGLLPLSITLSAKDTGGELLVFEHNGIQKGGPPRHVHYAQDEWFYVIEGEFVFEVGDRRLRLGPGETLFAPRNVPHGWAHAGAQQGTLLTTVSPAGTFETFILETTTQPTLPSPKEVEKAFASHGMKVVGPPIDI